MKKVLFVIHSMGFGGAERSLINLLHELPQNRFMIDVLLLQKRGGLLPQIPDGVRILDTPEELERLYGPVHKGGRFAPTKFVGTVCSRIARRTRKKQYAWRWKNFYKNKVAFFSEKYDTAIAYVGTEVMYYVRDRVYADRKLVWIHNDYRTAGYSREDDWSFLESMDGIVTVSERCKNVLIEEFPDFLDRIHCVENISSSTLIKKRAEEFFPTEYQNVECRIVSIGRLEPQKAFDLAVEAAALLKENHVAFCWYFVGEGSMKKTLRRKIRKEGLDDCVMLLGARENPYPYIKNATVLVQSSRYEGKSVVLDEAKILAVPIVATAYPTVADQIREGKEGLIAEMSPQGIAEKVIALLGNKNLKNEIHAYLKKHDYGNQREVQKYIELMDV